MTTNDGGKSVFTKVIADSLEKESTEPDIVRRGPPANLKSLAAGRLLHWLNNNWTKSTISARQIRIYGPEITRNRSAIETAETLARQGWLLPIRPCRIDQKVWRVMRENGPMSVPHVNQTAES